MRKFLFIFIFTFCFSQINWEIEVVDSTNPGAIGISNSLTIDSGNHPHIVYTKDASSDRHFIMYAYKNGPFWQKEVVDSILTAGPYWGLPYYGLSLTIDQADNLYLSYYRYDSLNDRTEICYAYRNGFGWMVEILDTVSRTIKYPTAYHTSVALDTTGYPGIAYPYWDFIDSTQYIKYLHYNGAVWDYYIIDDGCPSWDWGTSLKIDHKNQPHVAFYQNNPDSLKYLYLDSQTGNWVIAYNRAIGLANEHASLSLALNARDYPRIAHSENWALAYSWWDDSSWHTEEVYDNGIWGVSIDIALDTLDNPHIAYTVEFNFWLEYCYKDTIWHLCGPVDPDSDNTLEGISLSLDSNANPHICYEAGFLKYGKGTFVGIEEEEKTKKPRTESQKLKVYPNPTQQSLQIEYTISGQNEVELSIYDITGARIKLIKQKKFLSGYHQEKIDTKNLANGVYFIILTQGDEKISKKFLLIK